MSWAATAFVKKLTQKPDGTPITRSEKMLLLMMSDYYNDEEDMAWPSIPELSKQALLSERQTQRLLHSLAKKKVIKLLARQRRNGGTSSNGYRLLGLHEIPPGDMVSPPDMMTPGDTVTPGDIIVSPPGDMVSPALSLNLFSEPLENPSPFVVPPKETTIPEMSDVPMKKVSKKKEPEGAKRCPEDFVPKESTRVWATTKHPEVDFDEALEAMRDWEFKDRRTDWDAVLRTWIRNEAKRITESSYGKRHANSTNGTASTDANGMPTWPWLEELKANGQ